MAKRRHNKDLPRKVDPAAFGGGRRRGYYTNVDMARLQLLCSRAGCSRVALFTWSGCADDNVQRPLCPECDVELNDRVLEWWGDPDRMEKIRAYRAVIEERIGDRLGARE